MHFTAIFSPFFFLKIFFKESQVFNLVYGSDEDEAYTGSHCHVDAHTYLVSFGRTGIVGLVSF